MPYPINTTGAEDSGFTMPDGNTFDLGRRRTLKYPLSSNCSTA